MTRRFTTLSKISGLMLFAGTSLAWGQASFYESFDAAGTVSSGQLGPSGLMSRGWIFRRQANPVGSGVWYPAGQAWAYEGVGCLYIDSSITNPQQPGKHTGAAWAILPVAAGQRAGDPASFWLSQGYSTFQLPTGRFQLRYSPSGGTSTGSNAADVGDFTTVLLDIPSLQDGRPYTRFEAAVPGSGRLALRYYQPAAANTYNYTASLHVDSMRVGAGVTGVPMPTAGQTVHWTMAMSPINLPAQHLTIPVGGTVIVDPQVRVKVASGYRLEVRGVLEVGAGATLEVPAVTYPASEVNIYGRASFIGTAAARVNIIGGARDWAATTERVGAMPGGEIRASYVNLQSTFSALNSGMVIADHVNATGAYTGFFTSGQIYTTGGTVAVRDSVLSNGAWININGGYLLLDRVTFDNSQLYTSRYRGGQTMYLNNLTAMNHADSCFHLTGYDYFFGPGNTITGNGFPVHLYGAGVAPGSTLPATGNVNNIVHGGIGTIVGNATFANTGIAYRIDRDDSMPDSMGGSLLIEPGVRVKMGPGAYIPANFGSVLTVKGLPEAPITFERLDQAQAWTSLWFAVSNARPRLEHCIIRGALRGVDADESYLRVDSCLFENNGVGASVRNYGVASVRKSRFFRNEVGASSSYGSPASGFGHGFMDADGAQGKPNWFEGNVTGLDTPNPLGDADTAVGNYWGDPSGPTDPTNPGGRGQPTPGANVVVPFLVRAPDMTDHPPVVRLEKHSFLIEEGDKLILTWTARDEQPINGFQIWHSSHGDNPGLRLLVDDIPGDARSWEITVPEAIPASNYPDPTAFRVVAIDQSGQQGFDELRCVTPWLHDVPERIVAGAMPILARPGDPMTVCLAPGQAYFDAMLTLDGDDQVYSLGGTTTGCLSGTSPAPPMSTDLARMIMWRGGAGGRNLYDFSNYFSIRPDVAIGDAPPTVNLLSPIGGQEYRGGSSVPIRWNATDDEGLRSFEIHASYNNGRTWHTIMHDLPGYTRAYDWQLPPSEGIPAVRVRIVARDLRFQNSSSTTGTLAITPGFGVPYCPGDFNQDGGVDGQDVEAFFVAWIVSDPRADTNRDGGIDGQDVETFFLSWQAGGC